MVTNNLELSFTHLCKEIVKKWKIVLLTSVIVALLLGLCSFVLSKTSKPNTEAEISELIESMTEEEKSSVEDAAGIIKSYRDMFNRQKQYNNKSIFQNLDAYAIKSLVLTYYVDNYYKVSYPIIEETNDLIPIIQTYVSVLSKDSLYTELSKSVDNTIAPSYYQEVISVETESADSGIFKIKIYADTDELLVEIGDFIKNAIEEKTGEVESIYGNHSIVLTSEVKGEIIDTDVALKQQENLSNITSITSAINSVESSFAGKQLTYLKYLVHENLEQEISVVKYAAIGAVLGFIMSIVVLVFKYVFSDTIKTEENLVKIVDAKSFGKLNDNISFLSTKIRNSIEKSGVKNTAIVIADKNENIQKLEDLIGSVSIVINPLQNQESYETLMACDAAVFVVNLNKSSCDSLVEIKSICDDSNIKVMGTILE